MFIITYNFCFYGDYCVSCILSLFLDVSFHIKLMLNDTISQKKKKTRKFRDYLLTLTLMKSRVKLCSPQNFPGASQQKQCCGFHVT